MGEIIRAVLLDTKWGPAINFRGEIAFLDLSFDRGKYKIGNEYNCEIYYSLSIASNPGSSNKNWVTLKAKTYSGLLAKEYFFVKKLKKAPSG